MREVTIKYSFLGLFQRTKTLQVPEKWADLNAKQFEVSAKMYLDPMSDTSFISEFFGINRSLVKRFSLFEQYRLAELAAFVMNPTAVVNFFFMEQIPYSNLLSPLPMLQNVSFEQFALFDTFFFDYANNPTDENLSKFVATIYLKRNEKISAIDFDKRVQLIKKSVPKPIQYAIFLNYVFIRDWLSKTFAYIFEKSEPEEEEAPKKNRRPKKPIRPDWNAILDSLVGDDILNYNQYKNMDCILCFKTINKRIKDFKNAKR